MHDLKDFGLLGIGACGGNQVAAFKKYNLASFYINSAMEDLNSLGLQDMHYYHVKGAIGCHKDRDVSKEYLAHNYEDILKHIERYLTGKYVFLFGSTGGGTSSGMCALMTELLENELGKVVIPVITIPSLSESLQAKTNSYELLKELFGCAQHTVFIIDNNKEPNFIKSNETLASLIYSLISDVSTSIDGIYDYSEICAMLEQKGYGILNYFIRKPTQADITSAIKTAVTNNIFADIELRNTLYYCGIKSSTMRKTVNVDYEELQLTFGYWRDIFQGYQTKSDMVFMSGLQYPMTVINKLYESIKEDKKKIELDMQFSSGVTFKDDYTITVQNKKTTQELSAREKLMKLIK
jgi:hypothetical protein